MTEPAKRMADAIRAGAARDAERRGTGRHRGTVVATDPLRVDLHGLDLELDADQIALSKVVQTVGVDVGDVLVLLEVDDSDWVAIDVDGPGGFDRTPTGAAGGDLRGSYPNPVLRAKPHTLLWTSNSVVVPTGVIPNFSTAVPFPDPAGAGVGEVVGASMWNSANPTRLTIPEDGIYEVATRFYMPNTAAVGLVGGAVMRNGSSSGDRILDPRQPFSASSPSLNAACQRVLRAGDYLELYVYQSSGGAFTLSPVNKNSIVLSATYIRPAS